MKRHQRRLIFDTINLYIYKILNIMYIYSLWKNWYTSWFICRKFIPRKPLNLKVNSLLERRVSSFIDSLVYDKRFVLIVIASARKLYVRMNNNEVDSVEPGGIVIAHLPPWSESIYRPFLTFSFQVPSTSINQRLFVDLSSFLVMSSWNF